MVVNVDLPKLECADCHKQFLHAAKQTIYFLRETTARPDLALEEGLKAWETTPQKTRESHVCPYCESLNLAEVVEAVAPIESVKSVDLAEVDAMIQQGYEVHELYARTATLIKRKKEGGENNG